MCLARIGTLTVGKREMVTLTMHFCEAAFLRICVSASMRCYVSQAMLCVETKGVGDCQRRAVVEAK